MRRIESARGPVMISCFVFIGSRELNGDISVPCSRLYYVFYLNRLRIMSRISPAPRPLGRKAVQRYNHFSEPTKFFSNFFSKKITTGGYTLLYNNESEPRHRRTGKPLGARWFDHCRLAIAKHKTHDASVRKNINFGSTPSLSRPETPKYIWFFAHLIETLAAPKLLTFGRTKKCDFFFLLFAHLIVTLAAPKLLTFERTKNVIFFCSSLT